MIPKKYPEHTLSHAYEEALAGRWAESERMGQGPMTRAPNKHAKGYIFGILIPLCTT